MSRYLKVLVPLFLVSVALLLILKWTAVKNFVIRWRGGPRKSPSLIRALPFDVLREGERKRIRDYLYNLQKKLTPTQILIPEIAGRPRGAPLGKYVRVSVVVEARDRKAAAYLRANQGRLATLILDSIENFSYEQLRSRQAVWKFKEELARRIFFYYGDKIRDISIVQFEIHQTKG
ncbi:MAG TPA: flagellar basal body-associated FliL family protein [Thermosulfurimonas dismutans]|uniref:Flagellar basal body-associated FliL family protein n=1 Tax=Thermosulfurimonas dismutans TaxID=999894 RepID=A0A7C3CJC1_9BACT|nr:flagellar basal body-associated FliL family protein [Thermosulfurimonas dismutans]